MRSSSKFLSAGIFLLVANAALAQTPSYTNVGRAPTKAGNPSLGHLRSGLTGRVCRRDKERPRMARRFLPPSAPYATARMAKVARSDLAWSEASPTPKHSPR